ncbi:unnamed protein product [Caenorhabditis angaria]|uniref:Protein quiver n=1 Tax=Caenorhabditis angaria TaxID=860376 RepID=A0A9P1N6K7_9PELO|nr:unnamed protein product [Caenorhabditis angaria]
MFANIFIFLIFEVFEVANGVKCYSCASTNMKSNFIEKQRGPPNRISNPLVFDDNCNADTWIIKDRSSDDCGQGGFCFKWQQQLNNSGTYSTMTFRGCFNKLYNLNDPNTFIPPNHTYCTEASAPLACLSDAYITEHSCWCQNDYCNTSNNLLTLYLPSIVIFVIFITNKTL